MRISKYRQVPVLGRDSARDRGQSLVELAITLPLLFLILFGTIDLGRLYFAYVAVTNASREGARYGMTDSANSAGIKQAAINEAGGVVSASNVIVECAPSSQPQNFGACSTPQPGDRIRVTVKYTFQFATLYLFRLNSVDISNYTIMTIIK